jgi:hypothetical protein
MSYDGHQLAWRCLERPARALAFDVLRCACFWRWCAAWCSSMIQTNLRRHKLTFIQAGRIHVSRTASHSGYQLAGSRLWTASRSTLHACSKFGALPSMVQRLPGTKLSGTVREVCPLRTADHARTKAPVRAGDDPSLPSITTCAQVPHGQRVFDLPKRLPDAAQPAESGPPSSWDNCDHSPVPLHRSNAGAGAPPASRGHACTVAQASIRESHSVNAALRQAHEIAKINVREERGLSS